MEVNEYEGLINQAQLQGKKNNNPSEIITSLDTDVWEKLGFQRSLGGFFYNLIIALFGAIVSVLMVAFLTDLLYPYPEIQGYYRIAAGFFFAIFYQVFDFGTAYGIQRFIAEFRVSDPLKMIEYVQFFVWYQMFTGLIQVTAVSLVVFYLIIPSQEYAYLGWIFLIICQKQWPGMLGTFKAVLDGMQLYNKTNILNFINGQIFQNLTNIVCILVGRSWGQANPEIGDLMGAAIGASIGVYIDDFFAMWLSMHYLGKVTKPMGIRKRDFWRMDFDKEVVRRCMVLGAQMSITPIIDALTGSFIMFMYISALPQYSTFIILAGLAGGIVSVVNVGNFNTTPLIAESYMNDKEELAGFYVTTSIRWNGYLMWMLTAVLIAFLPMAFSAVLSLPELRNYVYAQAFVIPMLIHVLFRPYIDFPNGILLGTEKVTFFTFVRVFEEGLQVFFVWFFLYGIELQNQTIFGIDGVVLVLAFEHFFPRIIKMIICWVYINRVLLTIKINWWQTLIGPLISSFAVFGVGQLWKFIIFDPLLGMIGILPATVITLLFGVIIIPIVIYIPLTGIFGCWDDYGIETFRQAVELSGPSKPIVKWFYRAAKFGIKHSRLHNQFKIPWEKATQQIMDLNEKKRIAEINLLKDIGN